MHVPANDQPVLVGHLEGAIIHRQLYCYIYNRSITAACCASPIQSQSSRPDACVLATKNQQKDGMQKQTQIASDPAVFVFV